MTEMHRKKKLLDLGLPDMADLSSELATRLATGMSRFEIDEFHDREYTPFSATKSSHLQVPRNNQFDSNKNEQLETDKMFSLFHKGDGFVSWNSKIDRPLTVEEIEAIFIKLTRMFRFQRDNCKNMLDYYLKLMDSRASRMSGDIALRSLHADFIGGPNANFRKWYFATEMYNDSSDSNNKTRISPNEALVSWSSTMATLPTIDCVVQVALYLLCWGEANNIRFIPECLCFIFKCCNDFYYSSELETALLTKDFLDHAITPLYEFYYSQGFPNQRILGFSDKDHKDKIGYDDMNQLFWYKKGMERLVFGKQKLMQIDPLERYLHLCSIEWNKAFYKIFRERRTWSHALSNFTRIWILHVTVFWYYTSYNSPTLYVHRYQQSLDNQPTVQATFAIMSLAGSIAILLCMASFIVELSLVSWRWPGISRIWIRISLLLILLACNFIPTLYVLVSYPLEFQTTAGLTISVIQFIMSVGTSIYLAAVPSSKLFWESNKGESVIVGNYYCLQGNKKITSYGLWIVIFTSKFLESYFYIALTTKDPIRVLSTMTTTRCGGDKILGTIICHHYAKFLLAILFFVDLILFFIDTYLWYIIWNCVFSIGRSFYVGISIWTPWKNIFSRLPKRIEANILSSKSAAIIVNKGAIAQIWNSIIIAMYREHIISIEQVQAMVYRTNANDGDEIRTPRFFDSQEDGNSHIFKFAGCSEAERRITFFAHSLTTPMILAPRIEAMPSFCCLIPHFEEKVILSLKEIIRELDKYSNVTMLEYLKLLHPKDWEYFVHDTKMLAEEYDSDSSENSIDKMERDLPYDSVGFKIASPEYILRTRIWASLRTQTLYRTISGFMNYSRAIKLLYDIEVKSSHDEYLKVDAACNMALRKFRLVVSMQKLQMFNTEERDNMELLLRIYPELQIAYLEESVDPHSGKKEYFSALIDGACPILTNGNREPRYRIKLSGHPILGDGKADNQNISIIFTRGEYVQLVDANQDNYIEECLKIRSILAEFEQIRLNDDLYDIKEETHPVAIIGTREYIFSENIGVLGDVAAGKEQTFGTLFARTLAHLQGKLHYGHPDFLNSIFMITRGGVSKAQRGLHLNEDIYAGINALIRGGRIKHCEYMQCGKGRDLGFSSILSFTTKLGTGMAEQMLSREYFLLGSSLPLDRFLSFYYAHPGFHLNNVFIMMSIMLFTIFAAALAAYSRQVKFCDYNPNRPITDPLVPSGCKNLHPVVRWVETKIWSIFVMNAVAFVPLFVQELTERGVFKAIKRISKHIASLSPLFEVFVNQTYASSLVGDITYGGAEYLSTGRGFATTRAPFTRLYTRYAVTCLYFGANLMALILITTLTMWTPLILYFWFISFALLICPSLYNPHQFAAIEFCIDYTKFLQWMFNISEVGSVESWLWFTKENRSRITGVKRIASENIKEKTRLRPSRRTVFSSHILFDFGILCVLLVSYFAVNAQFESKGAIESELFLRLIVFTFVPIATNLTLLIVYFPISLIIGPFFSAIFPYYPKMMSGMIHMASIVIYVVCFEIFWFLQSWDVASTILGVVCMLHIQRLTFRVITSLLSKELPHGRTNTAWWTGNWFNARIGWRTITQPIRELLCKTMESTFFVAEIFLGHFIFYVQVPVFFIPFIDVWHTFMLFWIKPKDQLRPRLLSQAQRTWRGYHLKLLIFLFILSGLAFAAIFSFPFILDWLDVDLEAFLPEMIEPLIQPYQMYDGRNGLRGPPSIRR